MMNDQPIKSDADVMYSQAAEPMKYHQAAHRVIEQDALSNLSTPEQARATADSWLPTLAKYEIPSNSGFAQAIVEASRKQATPEQIQNWKTLTVSALQADYGDQAGAVLNDTRKLIAGDKTLRTFFEKTGAGNHPTVIRTLAARAVAARKAGKL